MKIRPLQDRVLVELDDFEDEFGASGLVRPDIALDKPRTGTVLAAGPGVPTKRGFRATTLCAGDRVYVPPARGVDLTIAGRLHVMAREFGDDVIAQVSGE
jgi:chaperonin GroES